MVKRHTVQHDDRPHRERDHVETVDIENADNNTRRRVGMCPVPRRMCAKQKILCMVAGPEEFNDQPGEFHKLQAFHTETMANAKPRSVSTKEHMLQHMGKIKEVNGENTTKHDGETPLKMNGKSTVKFGGKNQENDDKITETLKMMTAKLEPDNTGDTTRCS